MLFVRGIAAAILFLFTILLGLLTLSEGVLLWAATHDWVVFGRDFWWAPSMEPDQRAMLAHSIVADWWLLPFLLLVTTGLIKLTITANPLKRMESRST